MSQSLDVILLILIVCNFRVLEFPSLQKNAQYSNLSPIGLPVVRFQPWPEILD